MVCSCGWFGNSRRIRKCSSRGRVGQPVVQHQPERTKRGGSRIEESGGKSKRKSRGNSPFIGCSVTHVAKSASIRRSRRVSKTLRNISRAAAQRASPNGLTSANKLSVFAGQRTLIGE